MGGLGWAIFAIFILVILVYGSSTIQTYFPSLGDYLKNAQNYANAQNYKPTAPATPTSNPKTCNLLITFYGQIDEQNFLSVSTYKVLMGPSSGYHSEGAIGTWSNCHSTGTGTTADLVTNSLYNIPIPNGAIFLQNWSGVPLDLVNVGNANYQTTLVSQDGHVYDGFIFSQLNGQVVLPSPTYATPYSFQKVIGLQGIIYQPYTFNVSFVGAQINNLPNGQPYSVTIPAP